MQVKHLQIEKKKGELNRNIILYVENVRMFIVLKYYVFQLKDFSSVIFCQLFFLWTFIIMKAALRISMSQNCGK